MARKSCTGTASCLSANYPDNPSEADSAHKTLTRSKWSNETRPFSAYSLRSPTNTPRHHSDHLHYAIISLYQHSYRHHGNRGSIKRGLPEARFVKSLFKLDSTVRQHWHFTRLKSKAQKGYIIRTFFGATCVCVHVSSFVTYS